jgi:hypothetical protein
MPIGEHHPGKRGPGTCPARPFLVELAFEQRCDRESERHGEPDVTDVEHRRMHGQREILQQRIEVAAIQCRRNQALERIRREDDECEEPYADDAQHAQHPRGERR